MNTSTPYTPLECLLLFQSLVAYGTEDRSFARIADLLASNELVKSGETYDATRLTSDALRDLYLQLLGDELRSAEDASQDATQPGSKKRKLQGAALPTLKEAQEHKEKLPILIERLYARYRDYMVREIRADEQEYARLQKDISEIERGEWDEKILKEDRAAGAANGTEIPVPAADGAALRPPVNGTVPAAPAQEKKEPEAPVSVPEVAPQKPLPAPVQSVQKPEEVPAGDVASGQQKTPVPPPPKKDVVPGNAPKNAPPQKQQKPGPNGSAQAQGPQQTAPQPAGMAFKWEPPYQAGPPHQPPPYQSQPSSPYPPPQFNGPYPPQQFGAPPRGTFPPPQGAPSPRPHAPSPAMGQHPHLAQPPSADAARPAAGSPGVPLNALADVAGQQQRGTPGSPAVQPPIQVPTGGYPQPYPPPQQQRGTGKGQPQPQWNQQYPPPQYQGTPGQPVPPPQNQRPPFPPQPNLIPTENRQYNSPYNASQGSRPPTVPSQAGTPKPQTSLPGTPTSQTFPRYMTGSGTRWTPTPSGSTPRPNTLANPPAVEPLSPVLQSAKLTAAAKAAEKPPGKPSGPKPKAAPTRTSRRTRASSTGSHLSTSAMSQADEDEVSLVSHVKEEVNTPLPLGTEEETGDTTADESASLPPHRRPGSRARYRAESPKPLKRKRDESISEVPREPSKPPSHVLWTRNFPKISTSAMESIVGHRNASTFAAPVKERDAPGYRDIVLRPQDLKSIRSAIMAGNRAATEKEKAMGEASKAESSIWLPISEDLIPPKGIINSTQLEKELMRMFANAIMFNPDPDRGFGEKLDGSKDKQGGDGYEIDEDGVVKDTKSMFADAEKIIAGLRSSEGVGVGGGALRGSSVGRASSIRGSSVVATEAEDDAASEATGDGGEAAASVASAPKRRRKA